MNAVITDNPKILSQLMSKSSSSAETSEEAAATSDGHDKPFCAYAITIIDNFKKTLGDTDNR